MPATPRTAAPLMGEPLAVELMNTLWADRDQVHDALATSAEAWQWMSAVEPRLRPAASTKSLLGTRGTSSDAVGRLRDLRDALRRLAAEQTGDHRASAQSPLGSRARAIEVINEASAAAPSWSELHWPVRGTPRVRVQSDRSPADTVVTLLAEQAIELFASDARAQLRACLAPGCVLYFVKHHPRREWCSDSCGNRARVARHYQRHRGTTD